MNPMMTRIAALSLCAALAAAGADCSAKATENKTTPASSESVQIPNPWVDCKTIEDAQALAGFDFQLPETPEGYSIDHISAIEGEIIQVIYKKGEQEICIRKGTGTEDISGDYNTYDTSVTKELDGYDVTLKGKDGQYRLAIWTDGEYAYAVFSSEVQTEEAMTELAESVVLRNMLLGGDPATWGPALSSAT